MTGKPGITKRALAFWLVIGALIGWQMNSAFSNETKISGFEFDSETEEDLDLGLFWDVWDSVQDNYFDYDEVDEGEEIYGAISGLVNALDDPYSVFLDPDASEQFSKSLSSELEGVGMELSVEDGRLIVVSPLKGTPAEKAGVLPGDFVYLVDNEPTGEMTLFDAIMSIRGEPGTEVVLTIIRENETEPIEIPIIRAKINVPTVDLRFENVNGKLIAVLELYQFGDSSYSEFTKAAREIKLEDPDGLVLDVRLNGGGYLDVSIEILSEFFEDERKALIVKRRNEENEFLYTRGDGQLSDIPLVVLQNEGSASASEIVAGAIQDYERGVIMGVQSFGKGSVQELASLPDGSSLRLTVGKWFTPADQSIDDVGIAPDIVIEMDPLQLGTDEDTQLQAALDYLSDL